MRDGPLPCSGFAGRDASEELLVAMAKINSREARGQRPEARGQRPSRGRRSEARGQGPEVSRRRGRSRNLGRARFLAVGAGALVQLLEKWEGAGALVQLLEEWEGSAAVQPEGGGGGREVGGRRGRGGSGGRARFLVVGGGALGQLRGRGGGGGALVQLLEKWGGSAAVQPEVGAERQRQWRRHSPPQRPSLQQPRHPRRHFCLPSQCLTPPISLRPLHH